MLLRPAAPLRGKTLVARGAELDIYPSEIGAATAGRRNQTICCIPLTNRAANVWDIGTWPARSTEGFNLADVEFCPTSGRHDRAGGGEFAGVQEIDALKDKLAVEKLYLEERFETEI